MEIGNNNRNYRVYEIRNVITGKVEYVGQTCKTLKIRMRGHRTKPCRFNKNGEPGNGKFNGREDVKIFLVMDNLTKKESYILEEKMQEYHGLKTDKVKKYEGGFGFRVGHQYSKGGGGGGGAPKGNQNAAGCGAPKGNQNAGKSKTECPHCKKIGGKNGMKRYHFNNCKFK